MEPEQRLHAADLVLVQRAQHSPPRMLAVDAVDDQLGHERVVEPGDLGAASTPESTRTPGPPGSR